MAPRSCPAENARPAPVSTTQPMPSSAASASTCRRRATDLAGLRAFSFSGRLGGRWGGTRLRSGAVEGTGVGAVRHIGLPGGMEIVERCEAYDAAGRSLSYAIIGKSPIPIRNYFSTVKVVDEGPNACRVEWRGT